MVLAKRRQHSDVLNPQVLQHPIQRLHPELLTEIFAHCIPDEVDNTGQYSSISIHDAPLLLCRVCSSWYSLATSTPRLWQRFSICKTRDFIQGQYEPVLESLPRGIRTWLGRSGMLPLNIQFALRGREDIIVTNALKALLEFSSRWERVAIDVSSSIPLPNVSVLPNLRVFDGCLLPTSEFPFAPAPSLKVLQIYKLPLNPMSISSIPWGQLTELIINFVAPILAVLDIVRDCPLLETLTIPIGGRDDNIGSLPRPSVHQIKHFTLRRLGLYFTSDSTTITVEYLTLPALKDLSLSGRSGNFEPYCYSQVLNLLTRSKCNLQTLAICSSEFEPYHLLKYLKHPSCQTLSSLSIHEDDCGVDDVISVLDDQVLSQLTYSEKQDKALLCPRLADLRFETCYQSDVGSTANALGRMVQSRCFGRASDERLRSLHLVTWYPISPEDIESLELAKHEGGLRFSYEAQVDYEEMPTGTRSRGNVSRQKDQSEEGSKCEVDEDDGSDDSDYDGGGSEEDSDDDMSNEGV